MRRTRHADAAEGAAFIEAGAVILAGIRIALVDVDLAARSREAPRAVALERSRRIHAEAVVLARRSRLAFVNVLRAVDALEALGARAHVRSCHFINLIHSS